MNRTYRIIFNCARGVFQVVSEHATGRGKSKTTVRAGACILMLAACAPAQAQEVNIDDGRHEVVDGLDLEGDDSGTRPSPWEIGGTGSILRVGNLSTGALTIRNGGQVNNFFGHIGAGAGSSGMATVRGDGSTWTNSSALVVGVYGEGELSIEGGGQVNSALGYLGYTHGSSGTVTVTGVGSAWTNSSGLTVGLQSAGVLTVMDGGKVTAPQMQLGVAGSAVLNVVGAQDARGVVETGYIEKGAGSADFTFNGGILRVTGNEADFLRNFNAGDVSFDAGGAFIDSNGFDVGITTALDGAGGLTKLGDGTLTLSGANSYTGATTVEEGTLRAGNGDALVHNGAYVINRGNLDLNGYDLTMSSLSGDGGTLDMGSAFVIINQSGDTVYEGDIVSTSGRLYKQGNGQLTLNGQISGLSNGLYVEGGTLALTNANSHGYTYWGNDAVLEVGHDQALGTGSLLLVGSGTLRANTDLVLANPISFFDPLSNHLTVDGGHNLTLTGDNSLAIGGSVNTLTKTGAGILTLSGDTTIGGSFDPGTTTVQGGTLRVNGRLASRITVNDGATLGGSGTVGTTTVADGGILAPGSSIGTLTVDGSMSLSSGSILEYELGSPGASGNPAAGVSDRIDIAGDLALDGTLNLSPGTDPADGTAGVGYYRLMTYGGTLTDNGLTVETSRLVDTNGYGYEIQAGAGNVDIFIGADGDDTLQHWQGGNGAWNDTNAQWLNKDGDMPIAWAGNHAVFKNQPGDFNGGMITVDGTQQFKGLQFVDDGYRLEGAGALETDTNGSEIRVLADRADIAMQIAGTGGIVKTQAGTLVLSGHNSYQGATRILGGAVSIASDANLGAVTGGVLLNGGTLATTADMTTGRAITLAGHGGFDVAADTTLAATGPINGPGSLIKTGSGTLHLTGANRYGDTIVREGGLIGDAAAISGNIVNDGEVAFYQQTDGAFVGDISGSGLMRKFGFGALSLEGHNTLDWAVDIGQLDSSGSRFSGNAAIGADGRFVLDDAQAASYAGVISGTGQFYKQGTGKLLLTGDSAGFAGHPMIKAGTLLIGDHNGTGALGGSFKVLDGATLGGSGTLGSGAGSQVTVASGGTLAPGNSIGTLTVNGDLVFEKGSRFEIEVDPQSKNNDQVAITGDTAIHGGSVAHIGATGQYDLRSTYTLLTTGGTLSGKFDTVASDFAFLTPALHYHYDAGTVGLELARNDRSFAALALTKNQSATAKGIESIGLATGHAVYDAIAQLPDDAARVRVSLDALSGEIHASAKTALIEDSRFVRDAAKDRVRAAFAAPGASTARVAARTADGAPTTVSATHLGPVVWSQAFGSWGSTDDDGNSASLNRNVGGMLIGADRAVGEWRLGALAGYSYSDFKASDRASSSGRSDNYHLGLYGGTQWGGLGAAHGPGLLLA
ncbi:autotransporter outer membrane beta-barrel domain-containing protein [Eoetvoesiella caeni]|uniref:Outer membrane autotransporter protein n=1 Tax=Eoetvoesiella caeni TaxID=645616 RepID=A0A366H6X3_9BURK|nr:autotransporter outer membrane beta-barrel domain-containing protein [Eoetvoesiella caeni]RBP37900.1 outer membrane autotransporter protein [Eoetvoesiella caeni]